MAKIRYKTACGAELIVDVKDLDFHFDELQPPFTLTRRVNYARLVPTTNGDTFPEGFKYPTRTFEYRGRDGDVFKYREKPD